MTSPSARSARTGTFVAFSVNGFVFATWMSRLPDIREALDLTPSGLGVLLLAISAGAALGLPTAGRIANRLGPANTIRLSAVIALPGICFGALMVQLHAPLYAAMVGLFLLGLGNGVWDVAQNLEGTMVEQSLGRAIMPWFHAAFSGGTVAGALLGAAMTWLGVSLLLHVGAVAVAAALLTAFAVAQFLPRTAAPEPSGPRDERGAHRATRSAWTEPRTLLIGVMVLAAAFTEGTANDWMAVAFADGHDLSNALAVVATAVFLLAMTAGRILGTGLLDRYGRVPVLQVMFAIAILGCLLMVFGNAVLAFVGAALWGVGASLGFPVGMSAAADDPERAPMRLSVVATLGYLAFLAGPPLLGFLGDHVGTLRALLAVGAVSLLAIFITPVARPLHVEARRGGD